MFHGGNRGLLAFSNRSRSNTGNQSTVSWKGTGRWAAEHFFLLACAQWSVSFEETVICFPVVVRPHGVAVETSGRWTTSKWYDSIPPRHGRFKQNLIWVWFQLSPRLRFPFPVFSTNPNLRSTRAVDIHPCSLKLPLNLKKNSDLKKKDLRGTCDEEDWKAAGISNSRALARRFTSERFPDSSELSFFGKFYFQYFSFFRKL